jgi:hypothetical protein
MQKFRANLKRMDRANSIEDMLTDLEELTLTATKPAVARPKAA